jgi:hypothetical protein
MSLTDAMVLTLINTVACFTFPKLLLMLVATQAKSTKLEEIALAPQKPKVELTSFPYCMTYNLTGSPFCKFRFKFCAQCSRA